MRSISTGVDTPPPRPPERRTRRTSFSLGILTSLLLACAPAAAPAATSVPAPAAAPAAPAPAQPAASPASASAPASAAPAAATSPVAATAPGGAAVQPRGQIVVVDEAEPSTLLPKDGCENIGYMVLDNVYDTLTTRDYSSGQPKLIGKLAESWARQNDTTWRFKLRQGITFSNGEPFSADAVVARVKDLANPAAPGRCLAEFGTLSNAQKVDDYTVDVMTGDPDPILPVRLLRLGIPAPRWLTTSSPDVLSSSAVGSGPYLLSEWQRGVQLTMKANPNYWGNPKPTIAEVKLLGRTEPAVRANMVQAGEVQLAYLVPPELKGQLPQALIESTPEAITLRFNTDQAILKDVHVRQAIAEAVDTRGISNGLYPGYSEPLDGQTTRKGSVGYNPELKPYPFNPAEARKLVQEAGATGQQLELFSRPGFFPKSDELGELVANQIGTNAGIKVIIHNLEAAQFREVQYAVKPGQPRSDLLITSVSNQVLDSSRALDSYYRCGARFAMFCDDAFTQKYTAASQLTDDARDKAFREVWAYAYDKYWYLPLVGIDYIHGAATNLKWKPRSDGLVLFAEMSLSP
jgi:peptide/nickel transport system substrate-binding protein